MREQPERLPEPEPEREPTAARVNPWTPGKIALLLAGPVLMLAVLVVALSLRGGAAPHPPAGSPVEREVRGTGPQKSPAGSARDLLVGTWQTTNVAIQEDIVLELRADGTLASVATRTWGGRRVVTERVSGTYVRTAPAMMRWDMNLPRGRVVADVTILVLNDKELQCVLNGQTVRFWRQATPKGF
jgi:hypothetical protein